MKFEGILKNKVLEEIKRIILACIYCYLHNKDKKKTPKNLIKPAVLLVF